MAVHTIKYSTHALIMTRECRIADQRLLVLTAENDAKGWPREMADIRDDFLAEIWSVWMERLAADD